MTMTKNQLSTAFASDPEVNAVAGAQSKTNGREAASFRSAEDSAQLFEPLSALSAERQEQQRADYADGQAK